jgi:Rrf2 family protein
MISLTAEHALRAVAYLAGNPGVWITAERIATDSAIQAGSLAKVMQQLHRAGLVRSQRGPTGGFQLIPAPELLTLAQVVHAIDEPLPASGGAAVQRDAIASYLGALRERVETQMRTTTIAQALERHCPPPTGIQAPA